MTLKKNLAEARDEATKLDPGLDQLARNLASNSALTQGWAKFLLANWQNAVFVGFLIALGYLLYDRYLITVQDRAAEGSQKLENITRQFSDYQKILIAGEGKEFPPELRDNTDVVISTQGDSFAGRSALLYRAVAELESGHPEQTEEFLKKGNFKIIRGVTAPLSDAELKSRELLDELATLVEARRLNTVDPSGKQSQELLMSLAYGAKYTGNEAVVALTRLSPPTDERAVKEFIQKYMAARPENKEALLSSLRQDNIDVAEFALAKTE